MKASEKATAGEADRSPEEAAKAAPFAFPVGSFDFHALLAAGNAAAEAKPEQRQEVLDKALDEANERLHGAVDLQLEPGFRYDAVERKDLGVTEVIQVRDPKLTKALEKEEDASASDADAAAKRAAEEAAAKNQAANAADDAAKAAATEQGAGDAGKGKE